MRYFIPLLILSMLGLCSCSTKMLDFHILSTRNIDLDKANVQSSKINFDVEASDGRLWFLIFPLASAPTLERTVNRCLENGKGDFLSKGSISSNWWSFMLFSYDSYSLVGDVAKVPGYVDRTKNADNKIGSSYGLDK